MRLIRKSSYLLVAAALLLLSACEEYNREQTLVAGGKLDQVMMVMDDSLVKTPFSDSIAEAFFAPIPVLPQAEPRFLLNIRDFSRYQKASSVFHKYRNLSFVALVKGNAGVTRFVRKQLGDEKVKEMLAKRQLFVIRRDQFAREQMVIYMLAADRSTFIELFEEQKEALFDRIRKFENQRLLKQLFVTGEYILAEKRMQADLGFHFRVPDDFQFLADSGDVFWLRKEVIYQDRQGRQMKKVREDIFSTRFDADRKEAFLASHDKLLDGRVAYSYPFSMMDSIAAKHIHGISAEYPIYVDKARPVYQQERTINGIKVLDSRGLWRCDNPFMGGFFYTLSFEHPRSGALCMIYGFVYAAGSEKRPLFRKLDAIYETLSIEPLKEKEK